MNLSQLGEFGLIDLIRDIAAKYEDHRRSPWKEVVVGIGDDAAAWEGDNGMLLATTDTLVQGIHFELDIVGWEELGWKALAVNLSDIAAMGGIPRYALLSLAMPGDLEVEDVSRFVNGMMRLAREFEVALVGGNISAAPSIVIGMTIIGCSMGQVVLKRSAASPGDKIAVTGYLGSSAAGLEMLRGKTVLDAEARNILRRAHVQPMPRVKEGQILVQQGVKAAIDISDGIIADLDHICESSKVNAIIRIEQLPVHTAVRENFPDYKELALCGGEDYELVFTADEDVIARVRQALNCPVTIIGDITSEKLPSRVTVVDGKGDIISYRKKGWEHFKASPRADS